MKTTTPFGSTILGRKLTAGGCLLGALLSLAPAGCSILPKPVEDPTRYYLLGNAPGADNPTVAPKGNLHVGIRAVDLPVYLRSTRTIVVRNGANEVRYQDYARWAEPLDLAVQRTIRDRLQFNEAVANAEIPPFSTSVHRDFDISVRVLQCEGGVDSQGRKTAQFSAVYEILDQRATGGSGGGAVVRKSFSAPPAEWNGNDYAALAARLSEAVGALANDIAANLPK